VGADPGDDRDNGERNTRSDEAIFNGRGCRLVLDESNKLPAHRQLVNAGPEVIVTIRIGN